ncbi:MAG: histidine kinase [Ferruginibacter sp.]|nr:histidine kinase [Ferruginibacter sp.]
MFAIAVAYNTSVAQTPAYKHYDVSNGLPTNEVYEIKQDSKGFLWIGCDAGLVRYDGNRFKLLSNKKNRGPAISGLREDKNGRIWCINFSGQVFFTSGDSLQLFEPWEKNYNKGFADVTITDDNKLIISNFQNKIYQYDLNNINAQKILVNNNATKVFSYTAFDGTVLYTFLDSGLIKAIRPAGEATIPKLFENGQPFPNRTLNNFVFYNSFAKKQTLGFQRFNSGDKQPNLFYYKQQALYQHPASLLLQKLNAYPTSCFDDDEGNLFVGTYNELLWLKKNSYGQWILFNSMLQGNAISFISKDREGGIWISTLKNGIYKIPNKDIWTIQQSIFGTRSASVNHITTDGKGLIFGAATSGEIFEYNVRTKQNAFIKNAETRDAQALEYNKLTDELFISKAATYTYSSATKKITSWSGVSNNAKDFYFRNDGIVFTTGDGVTTFFYSKNTTAKKRLLEEFESFIYSYDELQVADKERMVVAEQRSKGVWYQERERLLWAGFVDGLAFFENKKPVKFKDPSTGQPIIAIGFDETADGSLYVATVEQGVYVIKNRKVTNHFTVAEGLLSDHIKRIRLSNEYLWIINGGTLQGRNLQTGKIKTINTTDGLLSSEIFDVEVLHDTVYVATASGIQFFPQNIETRNATSPVSMITAVQADEKSISLNDKISLYYDTKNITINLQGISLKSDGNFVYQYRLLPADTGWIKVSANENIVRFSSLPPGSYTFQSQVMNEDGVLSKDAAEFKFSIQKPWWQQWWFRILAILILSLLAYFIFKNRLKKNQQKFSEQLQQAKVQEELRQSQLSSLKAQMNPHFMFNALNSIQEFILLNDKKQANMYMGKFADMMRLILDMSNKDKITLEEELKSLDLYLQLESLRFEEQFSYAINKDENINDSYIQLPAMIIQPYVENAIKHGLLHKAGDKRLSIHFGMMNEHTLCCTVTDNGIGRKRSNEINEMRQKKYASFATGATQKRLDLLNYQKTELISVSYQDLYDSSEQSSGTIVTINIPV